MPLHFQPNEKKGPHVTVRFPLSLHATIVRLAKEHHTTVTEVVRALVLAGLEHTAAVAAHEVPSSKGVETGAETLHGRPLPGDNTSDNSRERSDPGR